MGRPEAIADVECGAFFRYNRVKSSAGGSGMERREWLEYLVGEEDTGLTVEQVIREKMNVSGRMLQRLTRSRGIRLNRKPPYLQRQVKPGDRVAVRVMEKRCGLKETPQDADFPADVLYEDDHWMIVNKPAGMMVHPVSQEHTGTLVHALLGYFRSKGEQAGVHPVHRLDQQTSGAVLVAKSSYGHQLADRLLREGKIEREYLAVLSGRLEQEQGTIDAPIGRDPRHPTKRRVTEQGEPAVTHYQVVARSADTTLVQVWLETGRTHQIRVHFQHIGHPLLGDHLYGGNRRRFPRQALHAYRLTFPHPLHNTMVEGKAALPKDLESFVTNEYGLMC
jgi:RluA family pseudouridine synthase